MAYFDDNIVGKEFDEKTGTKPVFKDSNDLFMENQEKNAELEAEEKSKEIYDEKTGEYLGQRK